MNSKPDGVRVSIFAALDVYHDFTSRSAAINMAIDEVLLETVNVPSIRFYRWNSPALSFGYFGRFADVANYASTRDLVRRWTGGGIVFHGDDLTYSILIPASAPVFAESSMSIYENVHRALCNALNATGQRAAVAGVVDPGAGVNDRGNSSRPGRGYDPRRCSHAPVARPTAHWSACNDGPQGRGYNRPLCFANPVRADVIVNGRKVAGAAQRRTRTGLLHQGSIQLATGRVRPTGGRVDLGNGLAERFAQALSTKCSERKIDNDVLKRAGELAKQRYGTESWLRKR
jgi:lipoate-protein ligase A